MSFCVYVVYYIYDIDMDDIFPENIGLLCVSINI